MRQRPDKLMRRVSGHKHLSFQRSHGQVFRPQHDRVSSRTCDNKIAAHILVGMFLGRFTIGMASHSPECPQVWCVNPSWRKKPPMSEMLQVHATWPKARRFDNAVHLCFVISGAIHTGIAKMMFLKEGVSRPPAIRTDQMIVRWQTWKPKTWVRPSIWWYDKRSAHCTSVHCLLPQRRIRLIQGSVLCPRMVMSHHNTALLETWICFITLFIYSVYTWTCSWLLLQLEPLDKNKAEIAEIDLQLYINVSCFLELSPSIS